MVAEPTTPWRNRICGHGEEIPDQLLANPRNWRIHPKAQQDALSGVLDEVGWVQDVIVNQQTGFVVDGHLRVSLAISRGEPKIPVVYVDLTPEEEGLVLATLDPLAGLAVAAKDALEALLTDVSPTGAAVKGLLEDVAKGAGLNGAKEGLTDPDAVPEAVEAVSKRGDVWLCGDHRVMCGDSTDAEDVARLMAGEKAGAVITDPPYGIDHEGVTNDDPAGLDALLRSVLAVLPAVNAVVIAFASPRLFPAWLDAIREAGHRFERALWMYKSNDATTFPWRGWLMTSEIVLISSTGNPEWGEPSEYVHDCITVKLGAAKDVEGLHTTPKPMSAVENLVGNTVGYVFDPFLGSGTTMIAAERLGRRCYGMEIELRYVDVAVRRWEDFTGRKAVRDG